MKTFIALLLMILAIMCGFKVWIEERDNKEISVLRNKDYYICFENKENNMFSLKQKQKIAEEIERLLLSINHPEMPEEKPDFHLHVKGKEKWSWADIKPNWSFSEDNSPDINIFNEIQGCD